MHWEVHYANEFGSQTVRYSTRSAARERMGQLREQDGCDDGICWRVEGSQRTVEDE
jgi:hypothetical protein